MTMGIHSHNPLSHLEQCGSRGTPFQSETLVFFTAFLSVIAFFAGYHARRPSPGVNSTTLRQLSSLFIRAAQEQYYAFAEIYGGIDSSGDYFVNKIDDAIEKSEPESDSEAETPKAVMEEASDYFPPMMSRRRNSDVGVEQTSLWSSYLPLDQMLLNWTAAIVEDAVGSVTPVLKMIDNDTFIGLQSPKVLRSMYETFKGEVNHIMNS